jgi:transcriptional regulator with XRE-family HTH domain
MNDPDYLGCLSSSILALRKEHNLTQEALAEKLGITFQAVSKWENGQSYPDISLLPILADIFNVDIDELFGRKAARMIPAKPFISDNFTRYELPWDDDKTLRGVVFRGRRLLTSTEELSKFTFSLHGEPLNVDCRCNLSCGEIQGNATAGSSIECKSDCGSTGIGGNATAGSSIACGNVEGNAIAGSSIACGNVDGNAAAGSSLACGNVDGDVTAGTHITCGNVDGDAHAGSNIRCGNVDGDVDAGGSITCGDIGGDVGCGELKCRDIGGDVHCSGNIECHNIEGDVESEGSVTKRIF